MKAVKTAHMTSLVPCFPASASKSMSRRSRTLKNELHSFKKVGSKLAMVDGGMLLDFPSFTGKGVNSCNLYVREHET